MHDLDRTQLEAEQSLVGEQQYLHGEYELQPHETEAGQEFEGELERPLDEVQEMELAAELLEVSSEDELDRFLGDLLRQAGSAAGQFLRSGAGRALGGILKSAAGRFLPTVGRAVGQWVAPGRGGDIGAQLASQAGSFLGLELEGLSGEDREFEVARQFVRFASSAAQQAALSPAASPSATAQSAVMAAARRYAPGLLIELGGQETGAGADGRQQRTGRWVRRGRTIVLIDV
jgi:hypothetical protein